MSTPSLLRQCAARLVGLHASVVRTVPLCAVKQAAVGVFSLSLPQAVKDSDCLLAIVDASHRPEEALAMIQPGDDWRGPPMAVVRTAYWVRSLSQNEEQLRGASGPGQQLTRRQASLFSTAAVCGLDCCSCRVGTPQCPAVSPATCLRPLPCRSEHGANQLPHPAYLQLLNKCDLLEPPEMEQLAAWYRQYCKAEVVLPISALQRSGLQPVVDWLERKLPEGPSMYPKVPACATPSCRVSKVLRLLVQLASAGRVRCASQRARSTSVLPLPVQARTFTPACLSAGSLPSPPGCCRQDIVSELPERFFVAEIIRKHIFLQYQQEVPYNVAGACAQEGRVAGQAGWPEGTMQGCARQGCPRRKPGPKQTSAESCLRRCLPSSAPSPFFCPNPNPCGVQWR